MCQACILCLENAEIDSLGTFTGTTKPNQQKLTLVTHGRNAMGLRIGKYLSCKSVR